MQIMGKYSKYHNLKKHNIYTVGNWNIVRKSNVYKHG